MVRMATALVLAVLAMVALSVEAACPNSCSGRGTCGINDQCSCYQGYRGNSCEQRVCAYGRAWTTTPRGDLNYDGDRYDAATYSVSSLFTTRDHVITTENAGGAWEYWPSYAVAQEGHMDMECSNAGLCNKEAGQCVCFEGFEGSACDRSSCPGGNTCNGHGRCMTIAQQLTEYNTENAASRTYTLWDKDMMRTCSCDPGYSGIGCTERNCPKGDDPLTKTHQIDETQYIQIYSTNVDAETGAVFGGSFTLTFKDVEGQSFTTDAITVQRMDGQDASTAVATATAAALAALPNSVVPSVTVTASYCEQVLKGDFDDGFAAGTDGVQPTAKFMRCPTAIKGGGTCIDLLWNVADDDVWGRGDVGECGGIALGAGPLDAVFSNVPLTGCTAITYPRCMQLAVKFSDPANAGAQSELVVDTSSVTVNAVTNAMDSTLGITSTVTKTLQMSFDDTAEFVQASDILLTATHITDATISASTITWGSAGGSPLAGTVKSLPAGAKIQIKCDPAAGTAWVDMGTFTVSVDSLPADGGTTLIIETFVDPQSKCVIGAHFTVQLLTDYIHTQTDYSQSAISTGGAAINIGGTAGVGGTELGSVVLTTSYTTSPDGYILLSDDIDTSAIASGATEIAFSGTGTRESETCSSRGLCDTTTGLCSCFKGYTGERCNTQSALFVGSD